jgi:acetoacetyl-CoA synthetase
VAAFEPLWLPFDHPLWIVYSSGTTGLPKPIVHGHGGTVLVALALKMPAQRHGLQLPPQQLGRALPLVQLHRLGDVERQTSGLLGGTTCVIFDGNPGGSKDKLARLDHAVALSAPSWA